MVKLGLASLVGGVLLLYGSLSAQTVVESATGTSVINTGDALLTANFSEGSIKLGYASVVSTRALRFGVEVKLKANDGGFASLLDTKNSQVQGEGRFFLGWMTDTPRWIASAQWVTAQLGYTRSSFSLVTALGPPATRVDTLFNGLSFTVYYNALLRVPERDHSPQTILLGLSIGDGRRNNYSELTLVQVCQAVSPSAGSATRVDQCKSARSGSYTEKEAVTAASDVIWYPSFLQSRIAVDWLLRYDRTRIDAPLGAGLGLFATKKGSPTVILGGFFGEFRRRHSPRYGMQLGIPF